MRQKWPWTYCFRQDCLDVRKLIRKTGFASNEVSVVNFVPSPESQKPSIKTKPMLKSPVACFWLVNKQKRKQTPSLWPTYTQIWKSAVKKMGPQTPVSVYLTSRESQREKKQAIVWPADPPGLPFSYVHSTASGEIFLQPLPTSCGHMATGKKASPFSLGTQ